MSIPLTTKNVLCCLLCFGFFINDSTHAQNRRRNSPEEILAARLIKQGDKNRDNLLVVDEWIAVAEEWYLRLDAGGAGRLGREEFLRKLPLLLSDPDAGNSQNRRMLPSKFLPFFMALDQDSDGILVEKEFIATIKRWFNQWNQGFETKAIDEPQLVEGLQSVFPKTNMSGASKVDSQKPIAGLPEPPPSPVLSPYDAIGTIQMAEGFEVKLAAAEPLIQDPVAMSFDESGNLYVVEMRSFMLDLARSGELDPICQISVLMDTNDDGVMDQSRVFLDQLIVPRAVCATQGGILFVDHYQLCFAKDTDGDGRADIRMLIDPDYGKSNIEHAPNGLMRAMDNWVYNGRSPWRYRWLNGQWVKEKTELRGQWGMTQNQHGRLFYNVNNSQLLGDFSPPNYMGRNKNYPSTAGLNLFVATDQRVFTQRMNTAVNRGYLPDVLDDAGRLHVFASSCSPVIYRGDQYGSRYLGDAFVCDPAANLIKRNHVFEEGMTLTSKQAYEGHEFLASTDERFRPVNITPGPDGCLWVLDMYRGVAQYGMFMTDYLRRETLKRNLQQGIHLGRLYRLVNPENPQRASMNLAESSNREWVALLVHSDGWVRDTAQRLIVESKDRSVVPDLMRVIKQSKDALQLIHALWSIEGLYTELKSGAGMRLNSGSILEVDSSSDLHAPDLPYDVWKCCLALINYSDPHVQSVAIRVCESLGRHDYDFQTELLVTLEKHIGGFTKPVVFQCALSAGNLPMPQALPLMANLISRNNDEWLIREAVMSGLQDWETTFLQMLLARSDWNTPSPGRVLMLQSLAEALVNEHNPSNLGLLIASIGNQKESTIWRAESLLRGMVDQLQLGSVKPMVFPRKPFVLETLWTHENPTVRDLSQKLKGHLTWPGHPNYQTQQATKIKFETSEQQTKMVQKGAALYQQICAGCHGLEGEGLKAQAPPLKSSNWLEGPADRLIRILLHGMQGPLHVRGKLYSPPDILTEMPPMSVLEDSQLSSILNFIRIEWGDQNEWIHAEEVEDVRQTTQGREIPWTETELLEIP